ncbi:MAG: 3'(2'),5'-bisphosphate nucleotidase CysQ [Methylobacteriaceae bacterium]|nr:3'(2'),5'-bisphosphate nucleotidase CysQ [Methylobacteriaceae bacterium]
MTAAASLGLGSNRSAIVLQIEIDTEALIEPLSEAAREAGEIALRYFRPGERTHANINHKAGGSPVTEADLLVDRLLEKRLRHIVPDAAWLSEEIADSPARLGNPLVLIVDPIDGTRGFSNGDPQWAVSIGLVHQGRPIAGVVHAPAIEETYSAARGRGAQLNAEPIRVSQRTTLHGATLSGPQGFVGSVRDAGADVVPFPKMASLAMRLVRIASGRIDAGLVGDKSYDWDIAAADLILNEAGGRLTDLEGSQPRYNCETPRHAALAAGPASFHAELVNAARRAKHLPPR